MTVAHARRLVRQRRAQWEGFKIRLLSAPERFQRLIMESVAELRARGVPAFEVMQTKPRKLKWPARLTVIQLHRLENGALPEDPTEIRNFTRYPDKWSVAQMRRAARSDMARAATL